MGRIEQLLIVSLMMAGLAAGQAPPSSVVGQWSDPTNWPAVAVHAHLLPTAQVMFYDYSDDPRAWNPVTETFTTLPLSGSNLFCSGHSFMADGRLLVVGGHVMNGWGLPNANIYDSYSNQWTRLPDMNNARWYPSSLILNNGDMLAISGSTDTNYGANPLPQVWETTNGAWRDLTNALRSLPLYPFIHLAPNGQVFLSGPNQTTRYLDTTGAGLWTTVADRSPYVRSYGTSVLYDNGKVLVAGGGDPPTNLCEVIDLNVPTPAWRVVPPMTSNRRQLNATLLPDGQVLVTGGSSLPGFDNPDGAVFYAEMWNPQTESWSTMTNYTQYRGYHSTALLLPDGRVLSAGGDNHPNAEIFSPPYLFKGARPTITSVTNEVGLGTTFLVSTPDLSNITQVTWIRLSSVTHSFNQNQRINRLNFGLAAGGLFVTAPPTANLCPPGHCMLFLLNSNSVPSIAQIVRARPPTPLEAWKTSKFTPAEWADPLISGELADPDADGLPNLIEYAFNLDPKHAQAGAAIKQAIEINPGDSQEYLTITYTRRKPPTDINYIIQVSNDLILWSSDISNYDEVSATDDGNTLTETVKVRIKPSLATTSARFAHVKISHP